MIRMFTLTLALATALAACGKDEDKGKERPRGTGPTPAPVVKEPAPAPEPIKPAEPPPPPADPTASWKETKAQGFVVRGPNTPQTDVKQLPTAAGVLPATFYTDFVAAGSPGALQVLVTEIPPALAKKAAAVKLIDGMREGAANALPGGKVVSEKKITVGDTEGTEMMLAGHHPQAGGFKARTRFFVRGNRIYQVQSVYADSAVDFGALGDKFIESFAFAD